MEGGSTPLVCTCESTDVQTVFGLLPSLVCLVRIPETKSLMRPLEKNIKPTNNFSTSSTVSCQQNIDQQDRFNNTLSANIKHC